MKPFFRPQMALGIVLTFVGGGTLLLALSGMPIGRCPPGVTSCGDIAPGSPSRAFVAATGAVLAIPGLILMAIGRGRR